MLNLCFHKQRFYAFSELWRAHNSTDKHACAVHTRAGTQFVAHTNQTILFHIPLASIPCNPNTFEWRQLGRKRMIPFEKIFLHFQIEFTIENPCPSISTKKKLQFFHPISWLLIFYFYFWPFLLIFLSILSSLHNARNCNLSHYCEIRRHWT